MAFLMLIPAIAYLLLLFSVAFMATIGIDIREIDTIGIWIIWIQIILFIYVMRRLKK
tara:strand:+ start:374 stop:544 length:171 start_codon:yes stop_codon:yes gene_type:complete